MKADRMLVSGKIITVDRAAYRRLWPSRTAGPTVYKN